MSKTLIIYSTVDYHTKRISEFIAKYLDSKESIKIVNLEDINEYNLNHYDKIFLGASIRYGKFYNMGQYTLLQFEHQITHFG